MGMHGWYGGFGMGFAWLFWLLLIGAGVYLLITAIHRKNSESEGGYKKTGGDHAMEILRERFARGEISEEEFVRMKEKLNDH